MDIKLNFRIIQKVILLLLISHASQAQVYQLRQVIATNGRFFTVDPFGNIYTKDGANKVKQWNSAGQLSYVYSEKRYGELTYIDARNPLKILFLFQEYVTIVTADNTISETGVYQLQEEGIMRIGAIASSFDNHFWIYDELSFQIKKLNQQLEIIQQSPNLSNVIAPNLHISKLLEHNKWVYACDSQKGIFIFDIYGAYYKKIPIKGVDDLFIQNEQLYYLKNNKLYSYNLKTLDQQEIKLPITSNIRMVRLNKQQLYILAENQLLLYTFK